MSRLYSVAPTAKLLLLGCTVVPLHAARASFGPLKLSLMPCNRVQFASPTCASDTFNLGKTKLLTNTRATMSKFHSFIVSLTYHGSTPGSMAAHTSSMDIESTDCLIRGEAGGVSGQHLKQHLGCQPPSDFTWLGLIRQVLGRGRVTHDCHPLSHSFTTVVVRNRVTLLLQSRSRVAGVVDH